MGARNPLIQGRKASRNLIAARCAEHFERLYEISEKMVGHEPSPAVGRERMAARSMAGVRCGFRPGWWPETSPHTEHQAPSVTALRL